MRAALLLSFAGIFSGPAFAAAYQCMDCPPGTYADKGHTGACLTCTVGYYCPGSTTRLACPAGETSAAGSAHQSDCAQTSCAPGQYFNGTYCARCPVGSYCPGDGTLQACPGGTISQTNADTQSRCCAGDKSALADATSPDLQSARGVCSNATCDTGTSDASGDKCMCRIRVCGQWSKWVIVNAWYSNCIYHCAGRISSKWGQFSWN